MAITKEKVATKKSPNLEKSTFWVTFGTMSVFWLLLTWNLHYQHVIAGLIGAYLLTLFNKDLLFKKDERPVLNKKSIILGIKYLTKLVVEIFVANIEVAKIVLRPKMPISPGIVKFKAKEIRKDFSRVLLGNSITLTPGTLTLEMNEDNLYIVHALTRENAESVADWYMTKKIIEIERATDE